MSSRKMRQRQAKPSPPADRPDVSRRLADAIQVHQQGQAQEAANAYRSILRILPDNVDALHFLGVAEYQLGHSEKALLHINRAVELSPDHPDARNNRGNILKQLGRLDEAEADYRHALSLRPDDPHALNNLGTILRRRGDLEGAVAQFREAVKSHIGNAPAWENLGNTLGDLGRRSETADLLWEALRHEPQNADSYRYMGAMLTAIGRSEKAADVYKRWLEVLPDDPRAKHLVAACTREAVPARASDDFVRITFDLFAEGFDKTLTDLEYHAPALVEEEVTRILGAPEPRLAVLDAGCGTGLCAPFLRPRASFLAGVDLSPAMIDQARKRALFDALVVEELTAYLRRHENAFDLIVSADTLVYFGDLSEAMSAAARALRPAGALVFTLERVSCDDAPSGFRIDPHGRYCHTRDYVLQAFAAAGLVDPAFREVNLRKEAGKWVEGWLCSARAPKSGMLNPK